MQTGAANINVSVSRRSVLSVLGMCSIAADLHVALAEAVWRSDLPAARTVNDGLFPLMQASTVPGRTPTHA